MRFFQKIQWLAALTLLLCGAGCPQVAENNLDEQKDPHFMAGKERLQRLDLKGAAESFEKALETNPRSASAHFELAVLYGDKLPDYAAAIYHYEKHLKLRPESDMAEVIRQRITACKMDLAKSVSLGVVTREVQKDLDRINGENTSLRQQVEALKSQLAVRPADVPKTNTHPLNTDSAARTHIVKTGETPASIARRYGVSLSSLLAANPGLEPKRMRVGQTVKVPASR